MSLWSKGNILQTGNMQQGELVRWVSAYKPGWLQTAFCPLLKKQESWISPLKTQERIEVQVHKCACSCHTVLYLSGKWVQLRCQLNLGVCGPGCCPLACSHALLWEEGTEGFCMVLWCGERGWCAWVSLCSEPSAVSCWAVFPCCLPHRQKVSVLAPVGQAELGGRGVSVAAGLSQALPPLLLQRNILLC